MNLKELVRPNIWSLKPYSSARHEFEGQADVFLDANENPYGSVYSRYPDPLQTELKEKISIYRSIPTENIFLGNGSDEAIDLIIRIFCNPGIDEILILPPTYGMYQVCADISDIKVKECLLTPDFQLDLDRISNSLSSRTKLLFICTPNNPTGNLIDPGSIEKVLQVFNGIVVLDEAYIDFAGPGQSWLDKLSRYPNLIILQTFSKAWGLAAIRLGLAFASTEIINLMNKVKPPYNVNLLTQQAALRSLSEYEAKKSREISEINSEKIKLMTLLEAREEVLKVYPSDANFLLVKFSDPHHVFFHLRNAGIIVRDRTNTPLCEGCLRITIGTPEENHLLIVTLNSLV